MAIKLSNRKGAKLMATKTKTRTIVRYKKRGRRAKPTVSLAVLGGFAPVLYEAAPRFMKGDAKGGIDSFVGHFTGYSPIQKNFAASRMSMGLGSVMLGMVVHKAANILGINRLIARSKIPFVRL